jgi:hypothetical protein
VSAPVTWDELPSVEPDDFDLRTMPERFKKIGDAHAAIDDVAHDITPLLEWSARDEKNGQGDLPYPAGPPEDAGRAATGPAKPQKRRQLEKRLTPVTHPSASRWNQNATASSGTSAPLQHFNVSGLIPVEERRDVSSMFL